MIGYEITQAAPPTDRLLTLSEARAHLRLDDCLTAEDSLIELLIEAVTSELDGVDGWLGRALRPQHWRLTLDQFPCWRDRIRLPLTSPQQPGTPVVSVVRYLNTAGVVTPLTDWVQIVAADPVYILPAMGTHWPQTYEQPGAVEIVYAAAYERIPEMIRAYAKFRLAQMYEHRELVMTGATPAIVPFVRDSLETFRARWEWPA